MRSDFDRAFAPEELSWIVAGERVGFCHLQRSKGDLYLKLIVVDPARQGGGLGGATLRVLQQIATDEGRTLTLSVYATNPSRRLYARMGFVRLGRDGIRIRMRWTPPRTWDVPFEVWGGGRVTPVLVGENEVFRLDQDAGSLAVRVYRPGRRTRRQIEAECAWADALALRLDWDSVVPVVGGDDAVVECDDGRFAVASPWVEGQTPSMETPGEAERMGRLLGRVQRAARDVLAEVGSDWVGHERPRYGAHEIDQTLAAYAGDTFASEEQVAALREAAARLRGALDAAPLSGDSRGDSWVHADAHRWNVIDDGTRWWLIDLDDSGFGPPELELATLRTHLRAQGRYEALAPALLRGWAEQIPECADPQRVALAAALHVFATMGEFPSHLDMGPLAADARGTLDRYLGYFAAELAEV